MFGWNKAGYAGLPLEKTRFTSEDLFVLLQGTDAARFACTDKTLDFAAIDRGVGPERWHRNLVARFANAGLVDGAGTPTDELAAALYPLAKPGVVLADAARTAAGPDERTVAVCCYEGHATAILRAPGERGGWYLLPFGERESWDARFFEAFGITDFSYSPFDQHVTYTDDREHTYADALLENNGELLRAWAARHGIDPAPLLDVAAAFAAGPKTAPHPHEIVVEDFTGCHFTEVDGYTVAVPQAGGTYRMKHAQFLPAVGFAFASVRSPRPGDPADWWRRPNADDVPFEFGCFDFIHEGSAFECLSRVPAYPDSTSSPA